MTEEEEERRRDEFDRKADKTAGCLFEGCFYGALGWLFACLLLVVSASLQTL